MARRTWTDEQRQHALTIYVDHGPAEAARQTGIPAVTIRSWAHRNGVCSVAPEKTAAATAAAKAKRDRLREELVGMLVEKAVDMLERLDQEYVDFRGKDADEVRWEKPPAEACKAYATAAAILVDKFRLELGEATSRSEVRTVDQIDAQVEQLVARLEHAA